MRRIVNDASLSIRYEGFDPDGPLVDTTQDYLQIVAVSDAPIPMPVLQH